MIQLIKKMLLFAQSLRFYGFSETLVHSWRFLLFVMARATGRKTIQRKILGQPMELDLISSGISKTLYIYGLREADMVRIMKQALQPGDRVLDIGANIGYYTTMAAHLIGPGGFVFAMEPDPRNLDFLYINTRKNAHSAPVDIRACAVTAKSGTARFGLHQKTNLNVIIDSETPREFEMDRSIEVPAVGIGDLLKDIGLIDFVRMDIEGQELRILAAMASARETGDFPPPKRIAFEAHGHLYQGNPCRMEAVLAGLFRMGYRVETLSAYMEDGGRYLTPLGYLPAARVKSEYHEWGIYHGLKGKDAINAVCTPGVARHVVLCLKEISP